MKRNLKIFLLIAVCLITGCCLLYIREENEKQQIHSEKQEKETLVFLTSKRETRHIFEKIIDDFNESQDEIYVEHLLFCCNYSIMLRPKYHPFKFCDHM